MKKIAIWALLSVGLLAVDGNDLKTACTGKGNKVNEAFCVGYVLGAEQTYVLLKAMIDHNNKANIPVGGNGMRNGQFEAIVTKYLLDHPERLHFPAAGLINEALGLTFGGIVVEEIK